MMMDSNNQKQRGLEESCKSLIVSTLMEERKEEEAIYLIAKFRIKLTNGIDVVRITDTRVKSICFKTACYEQTALKNCLLYTKHSHE